RDARFVRWRGAWPAALRLLAHGVRTIGLSQWNSWVRRLLGGGAPLALVVIALLAVGCDSSGGAAGAAALHRDQGPAVVARTRVGSNATTPTKGRQPRKVSTRGGSNDRPNAARAVVPGAPGSAHGNSAPTGAGPRCGMTLRAQKVLVPCQLRT